MLDWHHPLVASRSELDCDGRHGNCVSYERLRIPTPNARLCHSGDDRCCSFNGRERSWLPGNVTIVTTRPLDVVKARASTLTRAQMLRTANCAGTGYIGKRRSKHANMKELRFDAVGGVWRDPRRQGILLVAGDQSGMSQGRFYKQLIATADRRFVAHLERSKKAPTRRE
jgi:hypothetical protein